MMKQIKRLLQRKKTLVQIYFAIFNKITIIIYYQFACIFSGIIFHFFPSRTQVRIRMRIWIHSPEEYNFSLT